MVFDQLSFSWSSRYMLQFSKTSVETPLVDVSLQNIFAAEPLNWDSHAVGIVFGSSEKIKPLPEMNMKNISFHRNFMAHTSHRNPLTGADNMLLANNVIYNWTQGVMQFARRGVVDMVSNVSKAGPMTKPDLLRMFSPKCYDDAEGDFSFFIQGNIGEFSKDPSDDNWRGATREIGCYKEKGRNYTPDQMEQLWRRDVPQSWANIEYPVNVREASDALYEDVIKNAGANRKLNCRGDFVSARDPVDTRILNDALNGTGPTDFMDNNEVEDVGGWPSYATGTACADSDQDGLPNEWEMRYFDCTTCAKPETVGNNGYLNIEHYLNGTRP